MSPDTVIRKWAGVPFAYGADCCQFAGDMLEAMHGINPMVAFRYASENEANAIIETYGSLEAAITATLGQPKNGTPVDGDVVVVEQTDGSQIAGVVYRGRIAVRTRKDVTDWPVEYASRAWSCRRQ